MLLYRPIQLILGNPIYYPNAFIAFQHPRITGKTCLFSADYTQGKIRNQVKQKYAYFEKKIPDPPQQPDKLSYKKREMNLLGGAYKPSM